MNSWPAAQRLLAWISNRSHPRVLPLVHGCALPWLVGVFYFRADSVPATPPARGGSPRCEERHLDASGILRRLDRGCAPARVRDSALGKAGESVSARQRGAGRPCDRAAVQFQLSAAWI